MDGSTTSSQMFPGHDVLVLQIDKRNVARRMGNVIIVPTDVSLPDRSNCVVVVEGGAVGERITVTDAGAALASVGDSGLVVGPHVIRAAARAALVFGVHLEGGALRSIPVSLADGPAIVQQMANAMRAVADAAFDAAKKQQMNRLRERIKADLDRIFAGFVRPDAHIRGSTDEDLRFDYSISIKSQTVMLDVPVPDINSIASVVLKQADLRNAKLSGIRQAIAYDDKDRWPAAALAQLKLADVPLIRATDLERGIRAIAA